MLNEYTGTVLFVSHDRYFIKRIATQILDFENERVEFYPYPYEEYLDERKKRAERQLSLKTPVANTANAVPEKKEVSADETEILAQAGSLGISTEMLETLKRNPGKERSKIERKIEKLETEMASSEEMLSSLQEQYNDPNAAADYEKLGKLEKEIHEQEELQEDLLAQIMEQEELLGFIESFTA